MAVYGKRDVDDCEWLLQMNPKRASRKTSTPATTIYCEWLIGLCDDGHSETIFIVYMQQSVGTTKNVLISKLKGAVLMSNTNMSHLLSLFLAIWIYCVVYQCRRWHITEQNLSESSLRTYELSLNRKVRRQQVPWAHLQTGKTIDQDKNRQTTTLCMQTIWDIETRIGCHNLCTLLILKPSIPAFSKWIRFLMIYYFAIPLFDVSTSSCCPDQCSCAINDGMPHLAACHTGDTLTYSRPICTNKKQHTAL